MSVWFWMLVNLLITSSVLRLVTLIYKDSRYSDMSTDYRLVCLHTWQWHTSVVNVRVGVSQVKPSNCFRLHPTSVIFKHSTIPVPDSLYRCLEKKILVLLSVFDTSLSSMMMFKFAELWPNSIRSILSKTSKTRFQHSLQHVSDKFPTSRKHVSDKSKKPATKNVRNLSKTW